MSFTEIHELSVQNSIKLQDWWSIKLQLINPLVARWQTG